MRRFRKWLRRIGLRQLVREYPLLSGIPLDVLKETVYGDVL